MRVTFKLEPDNSNYLSEYGEIMAWLADTRLLTCDLGGALRDLGREDAAIEAFRQSLSIEFDDETPTSLVQPPPDMQEADAGLAFAKDETGQFEEIELDLDMALEEDPGIEHAGAPEPDLDRVAHVGGDTVLGYPGPDLPTHPLEPLPVLGRHDALEVVGHEAEEPELEARVAGVYERFRFHAGRELGGRVLELLVGDKSRHEQIARLLWREIVELVTDDMPFLVDSVVMSMP